MTISCCSTFGYGIRTYVRCSWCAVAKDECVGQRSSLGSTGLPVEVKRGGCVLPEAFVVPFVLARPLFV